MTTHPKKITPIIAPVLLTFILFVMNIIPHALPGYGTIKTDVLLVAIFYWSVHRPSLFPPWLCFVLGVIIDIYSSFPLGVTAFVYVLSQKFSNDQRKVFLGQPYYVSWIGFAVICGVGHLIRALVFYLLQNRPIDTSQLGLSIALTIAIFPLITLILIAAHRWMIQIERG